MAIQYDVVIVGAGPAGIFAALELTRLRPQARVLVVEKGHPIARRRCPARETACVGCRTCDIMTGWGGAGAFSDGKLTLTTEVGGWLPDFMEHDLLEQLIADSDKIWLEFGASTEIHGPSPAAAVALCEEAAEAGMKLVPMSIRHLGTDRSPQVLDAMRVALEDRGVEIRTEVSAARLIARDGRIEAVELVDGTVVHAESVVVAPGREGADWLAAQARTLQIPLTNNAVDVGVRVECPAPIMERLTDALYEAKLVYTTPTFGDTVRTFCMNPRGEVSTESYGDVLTVNGHSYAELKTEYTNFAVLVSQRFTEPFNDPITYGRSIAKLANLLGDGILVQRYADLMQGRRSTPARIAEAGIEPTLRATPGDLSAVLPYRHLSAIIEFLSALDRLAPGLVGPETLMYGVEVKFYSSRLEIGPDMQTAVRGLYAIGDGAGITRGLVQASASGMLAARSIASAR